MLSIMTYLPLIGAVLILVVPKNDNLIRWIALVTTLVILVLSLITTIGFQHNATEQYQYTEFLRGWIPSIGSGYHMGVDGGSVLMVQLNGILFVIAVIASWKPIQTQVRAYYFSMQLLYVGLMGVFCA